MSVKILVIYYIFLDRGYFSYPGPQEIFEEGDSLSRCAVYIDTGYFIQGATDALLTALLSALSIRAY